MKKLHRLFIMLMLATLTMSCSDDDDAAPDSIITITTSEFTIAPEQDSQAKALFNINVDWTANISYEGNAKDWLTATPTSGGAGDVEIVMKATENLSDTERKAFLTINYEGGSHQLTITQIIKGTTDITKYFDDKFAAKLQEKDYIPDAKKILFSDVMNITNLDVSTHRTEVELTSLVGIEYFKSLTDLFCYNNKLTTLDVSKNTALTGLSCDGNPLKTLDVSKNTALDDLSCTNNQLTTLDVSKNTALTRLNCEDNSLTTLDISKNTALTYLWCENNQLTTLDISKNTALTGLICENNQLTTLDISKNTALTGLICENNQLTTLDISKNTALTGLNCKNNQLTTLDISKNTALNWLDCENNQLTTLGLSKNAALTYLDCSYNQLTTIDISKNTALNSLNCYSNPGVGSTFVVKSWFDNNNIPSSNFTKEAWDFNGRSIAIDYQKVSL